MNNEDLLESVLLEVTGLVCESYILSTGMKTLMMTVVELQPCKPDYVKAHRFC